MSGILVEAPAPAESPPGPLDMIFFGKRHGQWVAANPNHHLWNNNCWWFTHYTIYPTARTKERVRQSLKTTCLETARARRDALFVHMVAEGRLVRSGPRV